MSRHTMFAIFFGIVTCITVGTSVNAAAAKYPTMAVMTAFADACENLHDEQSIRSHADKLGWNEVLPESSGHTASELARVKKNQRESLPRFVSAGSDKPVHFVNAFEKKVHGEELSLMVIGMFTDDWENVSCLIYDYGEIRRPNEKELEVSTDQAVTEYETASGLARWKWVPGFIQGHQGGQVQHIRPGRKAAKSFPNSGLQIRTVKHVDVSQKGENNE